MRKTCLFLSGLLFSACAFSQSLAIRYFMPASGPVGTSVSIVGSGFGSNPASDIVYFGGVQASVQSVQDSEIRVTVPAGASYLPVSVTRSGLTAFGKSPFMVTFPGGDSAFSSGSFKPKKDLSAGTGYAHSVVIADLNNDGKPDWIVAQGSSTANTIFSNSSSATAITAATAGTLLSPGSDHQGSAAGDLDGDGRIDYVVCNGVGDSSVSVFRNTGGFSFTAKLDLPCHNGPYSVAIGDLDNDGKPDIAIANNGDQYGTYGITVYLNRSVPGALSFAAQMNFPCGTSPFGVAIADFDGDGKNDLAVSDENTSSGIFILTNTGSGGVLSFSGPVNYAYLAGGFQISAGDLDGDGRPDLVTAAAGSGMVVLHNSSIPGNISFDPAQTFPAGRYPESASIGDINGDGKPDIVSADNQGNAVFALRNTSNPGNIRFDPAVSFAVLENPIGAAIGDINGDGKPEIIVANSSSSSISILQNIIGSNVAPVLVSFSPNSAGKGMPVTIRGLNLGDATAVRFGNVPAASFHIDSVNQLTAIVGNGESGILGVTTPDGTASLAGFSFNGPVIASFTPVSGNAGSVVSITGRGFTGVKAVSFGGTAAASFQFVSDSLVTAVVGTGLSGSVTLTTDSGRYDLAGFSFGAPVISSISPGGGPAGSTVAIFGRAFDARPGFNVVRFGAAAGTVLSATATELQVKVPAGATYEPPTVTTDYLTAYARQPFLVTFQSDSIRLDSGTYEKLTDLNSGGNYPSRMAIGDLNQDGVNDLIVINRISQEATILTPQSGGNGFQLTARLNLLSAPDPTHVGTGDFNGDGKPDVVVVNFNSGNAGGLSVFKNTGTGGNFAFDTAITYPAGDGPGGVGIADMDGDGKPDIVVGSGNSGYIYFFKNTTADSVHISFAPPVGIRMLSHSDELVITDLDQDGRPDIVSANFSGNNITVNWNRSSNGIFSYQTGPDYPAGSNPDAITAGDVNGDGYPDIVVSNYSSGNAMLFLNDGGGLLNKTQEIPLNGTNLAMADLDGDGSVDLFTGSQGSGNISLFRNSPDGQGNFFRAPVKIKTGSFDTYVAAGDVDGDGKPEIFVSNTTDNMISVLHGVSRQPVIGTNGKLTLCPGDSISLTSSIALGNQWSVNGQPVAGATGQRYTTMIPGKYTVSVNGVEADPVSISAVNIRTPSITLSGGNLLHSSGAAGNLWYLNGQLLPAGNSDTLIADKKGIYTVTDTALGCTSHPSAPYIVTSTAVITLPNGKVVNLFPNPVTNYLVFSGNFTAATGLSVSLTTLQGNQVFTMDNVSQGTSINLSSVPSGLYLMKVYDPVQKASKSVKIMKR